MCVGYEFLLLPNKMPTKTPNREMSVDSCFSASRETLILHIQNLQNSILMKNSMTLFIHQIFANAFAVRKKSMIFPIKKYSEIT